MRFKFRDELEQAIDEETGEPYWRFDQAALEAAQAETSGSERILGSRFITLQEAVQSSPDLMTAAGAGLLVAHLLGSDVLAVTGVEKPTE